MISVLLLMGMLGSVLSGILPQAAAAGAQKVNLKINTQHCTVYYNEKISGQDWSHQLLKAESDIIRMGMEWPYGIVLFLAPEEGYALSKFMAGNTAGNYYPISDGQEDGTGCTFLSRREHYQGLLKAKYTEEEIKGLVGAAIKMGCHCALLFSREAGFHSDITSTLKFYAEKLPTLEHKIRSVTPAGGGQALPYTEGMGLGVGDVVNYELTAAFYPLKNQDAPLAYRDIYVTDQMWGSDGANKVKIEPPTAEEQKASEGKTYTVPGQYTVTAEDFQRGRLHMQAEISYQYQPQQCRVWYAAAHTARAELAVRPCVSYKYESATQGMVLPPSLAEQTPRDDGRYDVNAQVTVPKHPLSPHWDGTNNGYWTLEDDGCWRNGFLEVAADGTFTLPAVPVTLTAKWAFTEAPDMKVEKSGKITWAPRAGKEDETVAYSVDYTISVQNTGGEPLREVVIRDDTLPQDPSAIQVLAAGAAVTNYTAEQSGQALTLRLADGLQPNEILEITYSIQRTGTLGYKTLLADKSQADITAVGKRTGVKVEQECELTLQTTLQNAIILTPADMVIYAGGSADGGRVVKGTNLPEVGFFVTLPLDAEARLRAELNTQEQSDLTPYLTFLSDNGQKWRLVLFNAEHPKLYDRFLYLLRPEGDSQERFELQFFDPVNKTTVTQSGFTITSGLYREYEVTIAPGSVSVQNPQGVLEANGVTLGRYDVDVIPGKLSVRGTTDRLMTNDIQLASEVNASGRIVACTEKDGVEYCLNGSNMPVKPDKVKLLVDHIADPSCGSILQKMAADVLTGIRQEADSPLEFQYRYLDLVDTDMGNTWIKVNKPVEILWPYPAGMGKDDHFTIVHYKGMDRNYNLSEIENQSCELTVFTTEMRADDPDPQIVYHQLKREEQGLSFFTDSFSPFMLIWESKKENQPNPVPTPVPGGGHSGEGSHTPPQTGWDKRKPHGTTASSDPGGSRQADAQEHRQYLAGYPDGTFRPDAPLTRAEATVIVNNMLGRAADQKFIDQVWDRRGLFADLTRDHWAYYYIMEASISHAYGTDGKSELWKQIPYRRF